MKEAKSIIDFLQEIKSIIDDLALIGITIDVEDLMLKILNGLDDSYHEISSAIQAREQPIGFDELHDKLLSIEVQLEACTANSASQPATAFYSTSQSCPALKPKPKQSTPNYNPPATAPAPSRLPGYGPKPYLGKCQLCGVQGHSARRCPSYTHAADRSNSGRMVYSSPLAHAATASPTSSEWLLDCGVSHHITTVLANLSLHAPYTGPDSVLIGEGKSLPISNTCTLDIPCSSSLSFTNSLHVPHMSRNLISVSRLCLANDVDIVFSSHGFQVKDRHTGDTRLRG